MGHMLAGSTAELPMQYMMKNLTDFDLMSFPLTVCAISPTNPFPDKFQGDVLLVEINNAYPGFARLKYCNSSHAYFKRSQLLKSNLPGPALKGTFLGVNMHSSLEETIRFQEQLQKYNITTLDVVSCVVCPIWPTAALEWVRRQRNNRWPTKELLSKVVHGGCHFVAKAHPSCPIDETLFRFSFSSAEIVLVNSWSSVQKYIYHILRLIKTRVAKQCEAKQIESAISSYTMKTLMLWASENKPQSFWNNNFITSSVTELLSELIEWLIEGRCQNYFIPSNNMFEYPMGDVELTVQILSSFVCNESQIGEILVKWPCANPDAYFPIELSDKLSLLAQLGIIRVSLFINPLEPDFSERFNLKQFAERGSELYQLVTGLIANYLSVTSKRAHQPDTVLDGDLARMARFHLDQSTQAAPQTNSPTFFYFGKSLSENIPYLVGGKKPDHYRVCIYNRKEGTISQMGINAQKTSKKQVPSGLDMFKGGAFYWFLLGVDRSIPKASYFISAAYRANFYFTHLKHDEVCLRICKETEKRFSDLNEKINLGDYCDQLCSVVLTTKWSAVFDQCIQTVFGFILLHARFVKRQATETETSESQSLYSFVINIYPMAFIRYLANQCLRRLFCTLTALDFRNQYQACATLLLEAVGNEELVLMTTESYKRLRKFGRTIAKDILSKTCDPNSYAYVCQEFVDYT